MDRDMHAPDAQGFIPLIHNYCDRRCEKCRFIRQCRVGYMEADLVNEETTDGEGATDSAEARLLRLMGIDPEELEQDEAPEEAQDEDERSALEQALAAHRPPEPETDEEADMADYRREHERRRAAAESAPLSVLAKAYGELVDDWLEPRMDALTQRGVTFHPHQELSVNAGLRTPDVLVLSEAFEEVMWFQHMLWVKCQRALQGRADDEEEDFDLDPVQSDWNGTAKLCLHIVERSLAAWATVAELLPQEADGIGALREALHRCRQELHSTFPNAEKFIRPGFDAPGA